MPEDATFREGMLPSELETKKVALAPEVCRQFLLRKQYILSQIHLHYSHDSHHSLNRHLSRLGPLMIVNQVVPCRKS